MPLPVHVPVLDAQHLALPAAGFEGPDETIVHARPDLLVLGRVHRQAGRQQALFLVAMHAPIPFGFVLDLDGHAEPVERRHRQQRRILEPPPVDCRPQRAQRAVDRRDLAALAELRLEPRDVRRASPARRPADCPARPSGL